VTGFGPDPRLGPAGSANNLMVRARSWALMPVVIPLAASTETVKWVPNASSLRGTIGTSERIRARSSETGAQISPRPWVAMKFTVSGVIREAAAIRSPSFSRSSSSVTMTILPAAMSAMIASIGLKTGSFMDVNVSADGPVTRGGEEVVSRPGNSFRERARRLSQDWPMPVLLAPGEGCEADYGGESADKHASAGVRHDLRRRVSPRRKASSM